MEVAEANAANTLVLKHGDDLPSNKAIFDLMDKHIHSRGEARRSMSSTEAASVLFNAKAYAKMGVFAKPADSESKGAGLEVIEPQGDVLAAGQRWFAFNSPWGSDTGHDVLKICEGDYMAYKPVTASGTPECYRAERSSFEV